MINRAKMPRQLRGKGGITNVTPRTNFLLGGIKRRIRKLIPNELANVAVKAAPFVAPFNPAIAGLMRGIGRFDQRGSLSDALKQGLATTAFGAGTRFLGGADQVMGGGLKGGFTSPLSSERTQAIGDLFDKQKSTQLSDVEKAEQGLDIGKKSIRETIKKTIKKLPRGVAAQLAAGTVTAGASLLASYFQGEFREQEPGETMEEYLAARRDVVGKQMRTYMDNYFKFDPEYSALDNAGRNAFVARYNVRDGGMPTGIMRTNKAGVKERDYRDKGGFVPVGIKEKADDVPAMLSKNEFVMTANAVRGAGGGSIEKGAQRMYDTMKKLEKRAV
jgi:hypothetical protein